MSEENIEKISKASEVSHRATSAFFFGALSGAAVSFLAPLFSKQFRPLARGIVKSGIKVGKHVQTTVVGLKEEFEDIAAEAKAELEQEQSKGEQDETED
jgi:Protein of unknown function (DUF5132)